ncbi:hypothetical protein M1D46_04280 [Microbacterium sp. JZ70]
MLSHYAKFVRPGFTRVEAPREPQPGVLTSAYIGPDGLLVLVAVNMSESTANPSLAVQGRRVRSARSWLTDATRDLEEQPVITGKAGGFVATLPPQSVTTFVIHS